jgi:TetR/AcrR family transcriptional regulator, transcriptional repressor for nem operon
MARPRSYDERSVVEAAMTVFWRKGYVATSMADLYAVTGLKPGNLYATFTDKETLFRRAFKAYAVHFGASMPDGLSGLAAIQAWLETQVRLATGDPDRKGCLIVNTITEREAHTAATQVLARERLDEISDFFARALREAVTAGELSFGTDIDRHAAALTGAVVAIMALGRAGADAKMIESIGAAAFAALRSEQPPSSSQG